MGTYRRKIRGDRKQVKHLLKSQRGKSFTLTAVGDILMHGRVYGGLRKKSGYDFMNQLINVEPLLGKSDITMGNLESIIAGNEIGLSSFPKFHGPVELGYTLKELGFEIITLANNHVLDMRNWKGY